MSWIVQGASLAGAALVLGGYIALRRRRWTSTGSAYPWFNFGALLLTGVAIVHRRIGLVVLETAWTAIGAWAIRGQRSRVPSGSRR